MTNHIAHLQQLPNFLQAEIASHLGSFTGYSPVQVIARYRSVADYIIATRRAASTPFDPNDALAHTHSTKEDLDVIMALRAAQSHNIMQNPYEKSLVAHLNSESIRYLTHFNNSLAVIQAQLEEAARQLAQRQAEEAARQLAQRQAEEAARQLAQQQAEEAARLLAQQQAEEAAARQLAERQAKKAAEKLAQQQAEKAAFLMLLPCLEKAAVKQTQKRVIAETIEEAGNHKDSLVPTGRLASSIQWFPGPGVIAEIEGMKQELEKGIQNVIADFAREMSIDMNITAANAYNAALYALKLTGDEVQAACG